MGDLDESTTFEVWAAIAAYETASKWRDVADIPNEGQAIGWSVEHGFHVISLDNTITVDGRTMWSNGDVFCFVTHWQPLPEPPQ